MLNHVPCVDGFKRVLESRRQSSATTTKQLLLDGMYYYAIIIIINSSGSQKINTTLTFNRFKVPSITTHNNNNKKFLETD